jgi:hypothetical protein
MTTKQADTKHEAPKAAPAVTASVEPDRKLALVKKNEQALADLNLPKTFPSVGGVYVRKGDKLTAHEGPGTAPEFNPPEAA